MINTEQLSEYVTGSNIWVNVLVYILRICVVTDTNLCTLVSTKALKGHGIYKKAISTCKSLYRIVQSVLAD